MSNNINYNLWNDYIRFVDNYTDIINNGLTYLNSTNTTLQNIYYNLNYYYYYYYYSNNN